MQKSVQSKIFGYFESEVYESSWSAKNIDKLNKKMPVINVFRSRSDNCW